MSKSKKRTRQHKLQMTDAIEAWLSKSALARRTAVAWARRRTP